MRRSGAIFDSSSMPQASPAYQPLGCIDMPYGFRHEICWQAHSPFTRVDSDRRSMRVSTCTDICQRLDVQHDLNLSGPFKLERDRNNVANDEGRV